MGGEGVGAVGGGPGGAGVNLVSGRAAKLVAILLAKLLSSSVGGGWISDFMLFRLQY